jgi:IS5 family transposase
LYEGCIDKDHFLAQLDWIFNWDDLAEPLFDLANNAHGGRPRYSPLIMLKMLFLSFLFDKSDRDMEFAATNNLLIKYFLRLPIDGKSPDHSSISRFRDEILREKGGEFFKDMFYSIVAQAKDKGINFSTIQALDATHTTADVNTHNDGHKVKHLEGKPRDKDASWGCKGTETKITSKGKKVEVNKYFYGYKAHLTAETNHGLVTEYHTTTGKTADIDGGDRLIHRVMGEKQRKQIDILTADKGYGSPVWINLLEKFTDIITAFCLPKTMTEQGFKKEKWQSYDQDFNRKTMRKLRYVIERTNGDLKNNHSLRRCRYLGLQKYNFQTAMASIAHNVKTSVRIITGARLRPI